MLQKESILPATIEEEGFAVVPGKLFSEIVRKRLNPCGSDAFRKIAGYLLRPREKQSSMCRGDGGVFLKCAFRRNLYGKDGS